MKTIWNSKNIKKLKKLISSSNNVKYIATTLKCGATTIRNRCHILNLKVGNRKHYNTLNENLKLLTCPKLVYFLGLLWADGYCDATRNCTSLSLIKTDFKQLEWILKSLDSDITIKYRKQIDKNRNNKIAGKINICNLNINKFLIENDYHIKSGASADKILSKIPEHLRHYWWRGFFDGDGCFSKKKINIDGCVNQDWSFVSYLNHLNIKYNIHKYKYKFPTNSSWSDFCISNRDGIIKFSNYIYNGYELDKIGLDRKYQKFIIYKNKKLKISNTNIKNIHKYIKDGKYYYIVSIQNKSISLKINKNFKYLNDAIKFKNSILSNLY